MSDEPMKVIAEFDDEAELEAALTVLNEAGIEVLTSRDQASASLFGQTPYELAQVAVPENRADEALQLLSQVKPAPSSEADDEGEKEKAGYAEQAIDGWLCHNCDTVVAETEQVCPECGTPRSEQPPEVAQTGDED
jgi:rubrerythrin